MKHQKDNIEKIFGLESNIDVDLILGYLDNTLTPHERHKIERALIDDPFLNEAIEGLKLISEDQRKVFIYKLLGKEPSRKLNIEIHPMVWKIAAVTIVAISSIYFISTIDFNSTSESLAHQEVTTEESPSEEPNETPKSIQKNKTVISDKKISSDDSTMNFHLANIVAEANDEELELEEESIELLAKKEVSKEAKAKITKTETLALNQKVPAPEPSLQEEELTGAVSRGANSFDMDGESSAGPIAKKALVRTNEQIATDMIQTLKRKGIVEASHSTSDDQSNLSKKEASALSSYDEGLEAYNRGNYHASVKRFEEAYKQNKDLPEVRYYLSTSYLYGNNNISKAKKIFKEESTGKYSQEKEWVKALIDLGDGKSKDAKETLEKIASSGSKFNAEAKKLLLEIE